MVQLTIRNRSRLTGTIKLVPGIFGPRLMVQVETTSYRGAPPHPGSILSAREYDERYNKLGEPTLHWRRATNADVDQLPGPVVAAAPVAYYNADWSLTPWGYEMMRKQAPGVAATFKPAYAAGPA